jgi:hypothetical protein
MSLFQPSSNGSLFDRIWQKIVKRKNSKRMEFMQFPYFSLQRLQSVRLHYNWYFIII